MGGWRALAAAAAEGTAGPEGAGVVMAMPTGGGCGWPGGMSVVVDIGTSQDQPNLRFPGSSG